MKENQLIQNKEIELPKNDTLFQTRQKIANSAIVRKLSISLKNEKQWLPKGYVKAAREMYECNSERLCENSNSRHHGSICDEKDFISSKLTLTERERNKQVIYPMEIVKMNRIEH